MDMICYCDELGSYGESMPAVFRRSPSNIFGFFGFFGFSGFVLHISLSADDDATNYRLL